MRRELVPRQVGGLGAAPNKPLFRRAAARWQTHPIRVHPVLAYALVAAVTLVAVSCQATPEGEPVGEESTSVETATVVAETTPLTLETPALPESEIAASPGISPTPATPIGTPTIALTPTPSATPVPPGPAVKSSARTLSAKLTAFRSALRGQGRPERAAQLQIELLSEAQKAEAALKEDQSVEAGQVREAIASIRDGAAGNTMSLEDAAMTLRDIAGAEGEGTPTADGTRTPGQDTLNGANGRSLGQPNDPVSLAELLQERVASYQQAQRERNTENLLRRQAELVEAMNEANTALEGDESPEAKRLREAIANMTKGLQGDPESLSSGMSAVEALGGTTEQGDAAGDLTKTAQDLDTKLTAVRDALAANDPPTLLRHQRELLQEVDRAEKAIEGDTSPEAEKLRSALKDIRAGSSGDRAKLDGATDQLRQLSGGTAATADGDSSGSTEVVDTGEAAEQLQEKVDAMQQAIDRGSNDEILRAQRELMDTVTKVDPGDNGRNGRGSDALRGAIESIRNGLGGDVGKFDDAERQLSQITGSGGESSASGTPASGNRADSSDGRSVDTKPVADSIARALEGYANASEGDDPEAAEKARADAEAEFDKIAEDLPTSGPEAQRLRDLLNQARGAVSGDQAKLDAARQALEEARR